MNRTDFFDWIRARRSLLWATLVVAALAAAGLAYWLSGGNLLAASPGSQEQDSLSVAEPGARLVGTQVVGPAKIGGTTTYPGTIMAQTTSNLAFRIGGPLIEVNVNPGDRVSRGELMMKIDPRDFKRRVEAAEASLDSAMAKRESMTKGARSEDILVLEARKSALIARQANLRTEFERNRRLISENAVSRSEYDSSRTSLTAIDNDIKGVDQELVKARAGARVEDVESMDAEIRGLETQLNVARDQLADTELKAPFDGTVARKSVENFEQVKPGDVVVTVHDLSHLEVRIALPEKDVILRRFDSSLEADVKLLAFPEKTLKAHFKELDMEADPSTRTYQVTFTMAPPEGINVLPGMVCEVSLKDPKRASESVTLAVPSSAVLSDESGQKYVWVVDGGKAVRRNVGLGGLLNDNLYAVINGLHNGESVVVSGASFLHDGEAVRSN